MTPWRRAQMLLLWTAARLLGRFSSTLGGWLAARLWFTPWPTPSTASSVQREAAWLADTTPQTFVVDGRPLRGFSAGRGPTVLMVHGWGDHAGRLGAFIAPLVAQGFRVVGFDLPGHGHGGVRQADLPTLAAAVAAVARQIGPVHAVIGHSLGGTASTLAVRDGLSPAALVLLASPVRLENAVDRFRQMLGLPARAVQGLRHVLERRFGATVWEDYAADRVVLDVPALVVHDADDPQVDIADARLLVSAWSRLELVETAGLGHQRILRDQAVIRSVASFVKEATIPPARRTSATVDA